MNDSDVLVLHKYFSQKSKDFLVNLAIYVRNLPIVRNKNVKSLIVFAVSSDVM
jgi:hypothetical protein